MTAIIALMDVNLIQRCDVEAGITIVVVAVHVLVAHISHLPMELRQRLAASQLIGRLSQARTDGLRRHLEFDPLAGLLDRSARRRRGGNGCPSDNS